MSSGKTTSHKCEVNKCQMQMTIFNLVWIRVKPIEDESMFLNSIGPEDCFLNKIKSSNQPNSKQTEEMNHPTKNTHHHSRMKHIFRLDTIPQIYRYPGYIDTPDISIPQIYRYPGYIDTPDISIPRIYRYPGYIDTPDISIPRIYRYPGYIDTPDISITRIYRTTDTSNLHRSYRGLHTLPALSNLVLIYVQYCSCRRYIDRPDFKAI